MKISSSAFKENETIPIKFTSDDSNVSPPLHIEEVPSGAKSLALVMEDPDAPNGTFHHWLLYDLSPNTKDIKENSVPVIATQGRNDFGSVEYGGPKPPSGEHHYFFNVYALDTVLGLPRGTKFDDLQGQIQGHVLEQATLMGRYSHQ